jgi:membrane associated rhomboid family serine protease
MIPLRGASGRQGWPWVTLGLIAANLVVYLYMVHLGPKGAEALFWQKGAVASKLSHPKLLTSLEALRLIPTMFSSLFLHADWFHLAGNMWFLWVFGEALEEDLGHGRFLAFYLFCGFFAGLFHVLAASRLSVPLIGASGAIAGVLGGYLRRLPKSPILTLVFWRLKPEFSHIPAYVWLGLWLALQFYGLRGGGTVAWMAHLGGFFMGLLTVSLFMPWRQAAAAAANPGSAKGASKSRGKKKKK